MLAGEVRRWLAENGVQVLNVAGPRESQSPGLQQAVTTLLVAIGGKA